MRRAGLVSMFTRLGAIRAVPAEKTVAEMEPVLKSIAAFEFGQPRDPLAEFDQFVRDSMLSRALLGQIERRLLRLLESNATLAGKDFACRQLSIIGTEASVPALATLRAKPETAEMARYALQRIESPKADAVLRGALASSEGGTRIGIVNSLGERRDAHSVPLLTSPDEALAEAAAERAASESIGASDPMIRVAGMHLLASVSGKAAVPVLAKELTSSDAAIQTAAIGALKGIAGAEASQALAGAFANVAPPARCAF